MMSSFTVEKETEVLNITSARFGMFFFTVEKETEVLNITSARFGMFFFTGERGNTGEGGLAGEPSCI